MNTGKSLLCFFAGVAAGAVAALFMAPDSGANTRSKIRHGVSDVAGRARNKISEGLDIIEEVLEEE